MAKKVKKAETGAVVAEGLENLGKAVAEKLEQEAPLSPEELEAIRLQKEKERQERQRQEVIHQIGVNEAAEAIKEKEDYLLKLKAIPGWADEPRLSAQVQKTEKEIEDLARGAEEAKGIGEFRALVSLLGQTLQSFEDQDPSSEDYPRLNAAYISALEMAIDGGNVVLLTQEKEVELREQKRLQETVMGRGPHRGKRYHALGYQQKGSIRGMVSAFWRLNRCLGEMAKKHGQARRTDWEARVASSKLSVYELEEAKLAGDFAKIVPGWRVGREGQRREIETFVHAKSDGKGHIMILGVGPGLREFEGMTFEKGRLPNKLQALLHRIKERDRKEAEAQ
jgi:hypothetical protein